jgi:hypothetical protein
MRDPPKRAAAIDSDLPSHAQANCPAFLTPKMPRIKLTIIIQNRRVFLAIAADSLGEEPFRHEKRSG